MRKNRYATKEDWEYGENLVKGGEINISIAKEKTALIIAAGWGTQRK